MSEYQAILDFWFGTKSSNVAISADKASLWWGKDGQLDRQIKQLFETQLEDVLAGRLEHWKNEPRGYLSIIILLDQFSRNMYRGSPRSFSQDELALSLAEDGIAAAIDIRLSLIERIFFYMPFEHAESLEHQERSVELFRLLLSEAADDEKAIFENNLDYAIQHQVIIERFGRFPHRNGLLNRESTAEEIAFLKEPGSSF